MRNNKSFDKQNKKNAEEKKYKLFDVAKFILVFPTFRLIQQSL